MGWTYGLVAQILNEVKEIKKQATVRANATTVIEIDTSITTRKNYSLERIFHSPRNILATQLTIIDLGGGFTIDVNNTGALTAVYGYAIENEEIRDIEIVGSGVAGTAKIRIGATM